jgi:hypothetical protein
MAAANQPAQKVKTFKDGWTYAILKFFYEWLADGMFDYQENRYVHGWIECRLCDILMMSPVILTILCVGNFPPHFASMLRTFAIFYFMILLSLKMMVWLVWESQARMRKSHYYYHKPNQAGGNPEDGPLIMIIFGIIILVLSSWCAHLLIQKAAGVTWNDPLKPSWSWQYDYHAQPTWKKIYDVDTGKYVKRWRNPQNGKYNLLYANEPAWKARDREVAKSKAYSPKPFIYITDWSSGYSKRVRRYWNPETESYDLKQPYVAPKKAETMVPWKYVLHPKYNYMVKRWHNPVTGEYDLYEKP